MSTPALEIAIKALSEIELAGDWHCRVLAHDAISAVAKQEIDATDNAPWLTIAHIICADAGIAPGHIMERLNKLRGMLEVDRAAVNHHLNVASQCRATATSELAHNILVDEGNGLLHELLTDAADSIEALTRSATTGEPA